MSIVILGTGKTLLLSKITSNLKGIDGSDKVAITATTGIAAIKINGTLILA
ncbi:5196_t:CDS:2 [Entrophospora sp. SA101]|nr:5196_t:CDS:2 [Entrophospora sp. SA101]